MTVKEEVPAILNGSPAVTLTDPELERWPLLGKEEEEAVLEVLRHGDLSLHPVTRKLEEDYKHYFGMQYALAHCNGTAALLAAYFALNFQRGDEVLVPSATHWASVVPMLWVGLVPVFCESEQTYLGLDPEDVERKITPRTKAMTVVHLFGMPSNMDALLALAKKYRLKIIEDASHAQGASWRGKQCGTFGDLSVFSLQTSKLAPAGEGGMLLSNDPLLMERAMCLGDIYRILELETSAQRFAGTSFGIKTRMAPLSAAVARVQLKKLFVHNQQRKKNLICLSQKLSELGFQTFLPPAYVERVYFEYLITYDEKKGKISRDLLIKALLAEGCKIEYPRYPLLHQMPLFTEGHALTIAGVDTLPNFPLPKYLPNALPKTEAAQQCLLKLPVFQNSPKELLDQYGKAFSKVLQHAEQISLVIG